MRYFYAQIIVVNVSENNLIINPQYFTGFNPDAYNSAMNSLIGTTTAPSTDGDMLITGATYSSVALLEAVTDAFATYNHINKLTATYYQYYLNNRLLFFKRIFKKTTKSIKIYRFLKNEYVYM